MVRKRTRKNTRRGRTTKRHLRGYRRAYRGGGDEKCIFVPLGGGSGLGNQMYQYAAGLTIAKKVKLPICILPTVNPHSSEDYRKILFIRGKPVEFADVQSRVNAATNVLYKVRNPHNRWSNTNILANNSTNIDLAGQYFQNYDSIKSVIPDIRADCKTAFEARYPDYKNEIQPTSAFIHVRRGDYGQASLGPEYYKKGIEMLHVIEGIRSIYILSDDIPWCKEQGWASQKIRWVEDKDELKAMYLMSLCLAGACISASTFSSWGAILGADQNELSTIIYPAHWVTGDSSKIQFPSRWKAI